MINFIIIMKKIYYRFQLKRKFQFQKFYAFSLSLRNLYFYILDIKYAIIDTANLCQEFELKIVFGYF
jgi:hypothetical protein